MRFQIRTRTAPRPRRRARAARAPRQRRSALREVAASVPWRRGRKRSSRRRVRRELRGRASSAGSCSKRGKPRRVELTVLAGEQIEQQPIVGLPVDEVALPLPADEAKAEPLDGAPPGGVLDGPGTYR